MILSILKELESNNSRNFKIELLTKYKDNELLKEVCRLANDPVTQFYQRKIPKYEPNTFLLSDNNLDWAIQELVEQLASRKITGNNAITHLEFILENVTANNAKVVERIIQKDLKCGVNTSTINKVWPNLIPEYPVLLCNKFNEKTESKLDWSIGLILQTKMDSVRINFEFNLGKIVSISTRNGSTIDITHFEDIILTDHDHFVLDGELMYSLDGIDVDRKMSSGIINKAIKGTISKKEAEGLNLVCWDFIPYECFVEGECKIIYSARFDEVRSIVKNSNRIRPVESKVVYSKEEALEQYNENLSNGLEGCILKNPYAGWSSKRSNDYLKMKNESTADLLVVNYEYGTPGTQFAGMLGALICETSDGLLQVKVGSGFKHKIGERDSPQSYVGKIIEVKYNEVITNKNSCFKSLFLPIYSCVRDDKEEANSLDQLE